MANVSSFFGYVFFRTNDLPWTPEGFLYAYDVLKSQDGCSGAYGICLDEEIAVDSAAFLADLLACKGEDPMIGYWGSGRWSAQNNFTSWDAWTKNKEDAQTMSEESYLATRTKLLELMHANGWYLQFDYVDEECGSGYISKEQVDISAYQEDDGSYKFSSDVSEIESYDYNLKNYAIHVDEESRDKSERLGEVSSSIIKLLQINKEYEELFVKFIIAGDWDELLSPFSWYEDREDLPEGMIEAWDTYKLSKETE